MSKSRQRKSTRTSPFGAPGRVSHDASPFYNSRLYTNLNGTTGQASDDPATHPTGEQPDLPRASQIPPEYYENPVPLEALDHILCKSAEQMAELPDNCIHLMVTSPPYNVGKEYDTNLTLPEYLNFLRRIWQEVKRVLVPGGRMCINVANLGRKPYLPLHLYIASSVLALGFHMRGEIIWNKAASASPSTAWGSWQSATNPVLRDVHEYILVFSKDSFRRRSSDGRVNTISREEFLEYTRSVWTLAAASARKVGHPAPFPIELPYRLIQLYTFAGEVVLDPFMGSGSTALAARQAGRHYVGYEIEPEYVKIAQKRIENL